MPAFRPTDELVFVGNGWSSNTVSFLGEAQLNFDRRFLLLLSGRVDKNNASPYFLSPRVAVVSSWDNIGAFKLIAQRSSRMNTAAQLLLEKRAGTVSDPEMLDGLELIYSSVPIAKTTFTAAGFLNRMQVLSWDSANASTAVTGNLRWAGVELEVEHAGDWVTVGLNHSFVKQLKWQLDEDTVTSGISYSDYKYRDPKGAFQLEGYGNDLNNWSNHATKLFGRLKTPWVSKLTLHVDARVFWGFQGSKDQFEMQRRAAAGTKDEAAVNEALAKMEAQNAYGMDARVNAALAYDLPHGLSATIYAMNLNGGGKRYSYDAGNRSLYPVRSDWVEEERSFGGRIEYSF